MVIHHVKNAGDALGLIKQSSQIELVSNASHMEVYALARHAKAIATDFDGTLTTGWSQWKKLERCLPKEYEDLQTKHRAEYHAMMHSMTEEDTLAYDHKWVGINFQAYSDAGLRRSHFRQAGIDCPRREGIERLFAHFLLRVAVSYGIDLCIDGFVEHHSLSLDHIIATRVAFKDNHCTAEDIVVTGNKGAWLDKFLTRHHFRAEQAIRVGDSWGDRNLFHKDALNVIVLPPGEPEEQVHLGRLQAIEKLWDRVPLVILANDSFDPLTDMIEHARKNDR